MARVRMSEPASKSPILIVHDVDPVTQLVQCPYHLYGMPLVDVAEETWVVSWDGEGMSDVGEQCTLGQRLAPCGSQVEVMQPLGSLEVECNADSYGAGQLLESSEIPFESWSTRSSVRHARTKRTKRA